MEPISSIQGFSMICRFCKCKYQHGIAPILPKNIYWGKVNFEELTLLHCLSVRLDFIGIGVTDYRVFGWVKPWTILRSPWPTIYPATEDICMVRKWPAEDGWELHPKPKCLDIPYARHYNPLLIRNRSWILTIHKARILRKKPLEKTFLDFKKWVKSIQTAGYNGARTVFVCHNWPKHFRFLLFMPPLGVHSAACSRKNKNVMWFLLWMLP